MTEKRKILITIDWFLPGTLSGGPVRSYMNLIEHLQLHFDFYIVTRNTDYGSVEPYENIIPNTWVSLNDCTKIYYISASKLNRKSLKNIIKSIDFDLAYINGIYSWYFSILPIFLLKKINKPFIISARGMLNPQAFSVKSKKKKIYLKLAKLLNIYKGVKFHATNLDEAKCIKNEIGQSTQVSVAPNLPRKLNIKLKTNGEIGNPAKFINIARIAIEKGTLNMIDSLSALEKPMHLDIFGPIYDLSYWNKCLESISKLPDHIKVDYKGVLDSEEVPLTLSKYDFFVLLSEGENFGHAIIEAFSVGLPVLISDKTPWKDLESKSVGWDVDINSQSKIVDSFNKAIEMTDSNYQNWSLAAFEFALEFSQNPSLIEQNKALFLTTLNN